MPDESQPRLDGPWPIVPWVAKSRFLGDEHACVHWQYDSECSAAMRAGICAASETPDKRRLIGGVETDSGTGERSVGYLNPRAQSPGQRCAPVPQPSAT